MDTAFARFESARLLSLGYLAKTCLRRKACEAQRSSECYQRQMAQCQWPDGQKSYIAVEKAFSSWGKAEWRTYSAHFLLISWLIRITVTFWCSLHTTNNLNYELLANIVFMTCNTISLVSRLIWKRFRWKFRHIRRCLLITYMLFCWFISPTLLHNAMRKFGTFSSGRHPVMAFTSYSILSAACRVCT